MTQTITENQRAAGVRGSAPRVLLMCAALALVMAISGAAGSVHNAVAWFAEAIAGGLCGLAASRWIVPRSWFSGRMLAAMLAVAAIITPPITAVALAFNVLPAHRAVTWPMIAGIAPSVFGVALVMTGLAFLLRPHSTQTRAAPQGAPPPKFLARLPAKLAGAELFAVEAEDHYLRLHTSQGQDLILMRLGDAIDELEGLEGAQTHRSWWVAKAAVASAEKLDGRAVLTLKDGAEVPVSRGFAKALRSAGWF
ncbi:MAG TPA: LytTR family DNA-binding domain-containing protein [Caulobacteraceae bacterium]